MMLISIKYSLAAGSFNKSQVIIAKQHLDKYTSYLRYAKRLRIFSSSTFKHPMTTCNLMITRYMLSTN